MKEISLFDFIYYISGFVKYCASRWKVVTVWAMASAVLYLAGYYCFNQPYQATVLFVKESPSLHIKSANAIVNTKPAFNISTLFEEDNLSELFLSKNLIENCLLTPAPWLGQEKTLLDAYWMGSWQNNKNLRKRIQGYDNNPYTALQSALRITAEQIVDDNLATIREEKELNFYKLTVTHNSENFARYFAENLTLGAIDLHETLMRKKVSAEVVNVKKTLDSLVVALGSNFYHTAIATDKTINAIKGTLQTPASKQNIEARTNARLYKEIAIQYEIAQLNEQAKGPVLKIISLSKLPLDKQRYQLYNLFNYTVCLLLIWLLFDFYRRWKKTNSAISHA